MRRAELILYATPTGALADELARVFTHLSARSQTTAQEFPPHCTLTGFFHRDPAEIPRVAGELEQALGRVGPHPVDAVIVAGLHRRADWVGLELTSGWLHDLTREFVRAHRMGAGDDELRPKEWLHVSIAYGVDDLGPALAATDGFDVSLPVEWEVAVWERHPGGDWTRHRGATPTDP